MVSMKGHLLAHCPTYPMHSYGLHAQPTLSTKLISVLSGRAQSIEDKVGLLSRITKRFAMAVSGNQGRSSGNICAVIYLSGFGIKLVMEKVSRKWKIMYV